MTAPIIEIDRVSKSFGSHQVLKELSFAVAPGEKLALIGPSGSGKTTILRILMTLETINGGHVRVDGEQLWHMPRNGGVGPAGERHPHKGRAENGVGVPLVKPFPPKKGVGNGEPGPLPAHGGAQGE